MQRLITLFFMLVTLAVKADQTIVPYGSAWKYLDNGTDQGTSWRATSFNDAAWATGNSELGYGDGGEATVVSYGPDANNKYVTTYFRKAFTITNVNAFAHFALNVKRDDGVVVYVNGTEVYRNNMTTGAFTYTTLANAEATDDGNTAQTTTLAVSNFVNGNNVIAVEIHQLTLSSSDVSFNLELVGVDVAVPVVTRGAYLNLATPTSIYIKWRTDIVSNSKIVYGTAAGVFTNSVSDAALVTDHSMNVTGLTPNTKYYYALTTSTDTLQNNSTENFFVTPPVVGTSKPTRIWVLGDMGINTAEQNQVRDAYYNYTGSTYTDLWLWLGDNAYNNGTDAEYQNSVYSNHYEKMLKQSVVWPAAGNHDVDGSTASNAVTQTGPYFDMFTLPTNGEAGGVPSGTEAYYSYNYANIHFVVLESTTASFRVNGGAMMTWLQNDLAATTQKWKVVYFHHPPHSMGSHNSDLEAQQIEMRQNFNPILEQYNVDLVLCGHSHNYERTYFINNYYGNEAAFNATHQVDAGSGAPATPYLKTTSNNYKGTVYAVMGISGVIEGTQTSWPHSAMYTYSDATYGSMVIDVHGDSLTAKLIDKTLPNPIVFDQFKIVKQCNLTVTLNPFSAVCQNAASFALTGGAPAGGTFSGNGVSGGNFNPATAGVGTHTITYTYSDGTCTNFATANITVNQAAIITCSGPTAVCNGSAVTLSATTGAGISYQWYKNNVAQVGYTASTLLTGNAGTYYCNVTGIGCPGNSNAIVLTVVNNPNPAMTASSPLSFCAGGSVDIVSNTFAGCTFQWQKNSINISGATLQTYTATASGKYRVAQTANGCTKTTSYVIEITTATSVPAVIVANGPSTFCPGGSVVLAVSNPIPGYTFQWKNNGTAIGGATANTYTATASGSYTCTITASCGNATSNAIVVSSSSITATVSPSPTVAICSGATATLLAGTGTGFTYQWKLNGVDINGATSSTYPATAAGSYTVFINSPCGSSLSQATTVTITPITATSTPTGTTTICEGQAATFTANTGYNYTYQWLKNNVVIAGATNYTYAIANAGSYTVRVTQGGVCSATSAASVLAVTNNPAAVITPSTPQTMCAGQSKLYTANTFAGVVYQWQKGSNDILGATSQTFLATQAGNYRVKETANGCSKISSSVVLTINCRDANGNLVADDEYIFTVQPNPFSDFTTLLIPYGTQVEHLKVELYNILGKKVKDINATTSDIKIYKDNLAPGIYLLKVKSSGIDVFVKRMVIK